MGFILVNKNLKTNHTNSVQMELKFQKEKKILYQILSIFLECMKHFEFLQLDVYSFQ